MGGSAGPRDRRRDTYFQIAGSIIASALALTAWLATGERGFIDTIAIWLVGVYVGLFGWIILGERRLPRLRWPIRRTPWDGDPDRLAGVGVVLAFGALNLTWRSWFPGRELLAAISDTRLPDPIFSLRIGLEIILAGTIVLVVLTAIRVAGSNQKAA